MGRDLGFCEFPFKISLSLVPLIEYWQNARENGLPTEKVMAETILDELYRAPDLSKPITDQEPIDRHQPLINMMMTAIFPSATLEEEIGAAMSPYAKLSPFMTKRFCELFGPQGKAVNSPEIEEMEREMLYRKTLHAYIMIFKEYYGVELPMDKTFAIKLPNPETGLDEHYQIEINIKFAIINELIKPIELTEDQITEIKQNSHKLDVWMKYLPADHFEFSGFTVFRLSDVTKAEVVSQLKYDLLDKESLVVSEKFANVQHKLRSMFRLPQLRLGVAGYDPEEKSLTGFGDSSQSLIVGQSEYGQSCSKGVAFKNEMIKGGKPCLIHDLNDHVEDTPYWKDLIESAGIRNMVMVPLHYDGDFIGILELGSPTPGQISSSYLLMIKDLIPLFSIALKRNYDERSSNIDAVIKKQYTAIHPSVEWRFGQAAKRYLDTKEKGQVPETEQIVFEDVYPLYAAVDIRSSSTERNQAIQADLIQHLNLTEEVVQKAITIDSLPIFHELDYKIRKHIKHIQQGLFSGDEMGIIEFLQTEVNPCFENLKTIMPDEIGADLDAYYAKIDPNLHVIYNKRKEFEDSLTRINEVVADHIEASEEHAQHMFPHYFEKYKTDGVEYNIYIGQSMTNDRTFSQMYLKNIRLWQLQNTIQLTRLTHALKPKLPMPLETTQLILVHSSPLSVRFRLDERQFDVDGAYNIRYEIVKKRIDKALIKGTEERLTQPGQVAIVYSQNKDAEEYSEYLEYLDSLGDISGNIEHLELEPLQGVQGLKALRFAVSLGHAHAPSDHPKDQNELIKA